MAKACESKMAARRRAGSRGSAGHGRSEPPFFLRQLWEPLRAGLIEIRVLPIAKGEGFLPLQRWFNCIEGALQFASQFDDRRSGYGVYFGVTKRARRGGRKQDVLGSTSLWADIDTVNLGWNTQLCIRKMRSLPDALRPSALIHSGGGLHAYWFLQAPLMARKQAKFTEQANATLARLVGGDAVGNIDRIMRLPGSWNAKRGSARAKRCRILYCDAGLQFDPHLLLRAAQQHGPVFDAPEFMPVGQCATRRRTTQAQSSPGLHMEPRIGLDELWAKQVRYHASGAKRMGINAAIAVTTARLHCLGWKDATIIEDVLRRVRRIQAEQAPCEAWNWDAERQTIRRSLQRWKPKWRALRDCSRPAMTAQKKVPVGCPSSG